MPAKALKKQKETPAAPKLAINTMPPAQLQDLWGQMVMVRRFEQRVATLYQQGKIGGFCHLYIGQEAVVVGMQTHVQPGDSIMASYRDHGHALLAGVEPNAVMAELTGRATGMNRGKGGSMHMISTEHGLFGGHGIVGAQVPIGTGLALSHKYRQSGNICFTYFGDGAFNQGQIYEAFNMASLWELPVLYILENNGYGMGTSVKRAAAGERLVDRAKAFNIATKEVDGMDVEAVVAETREAVEFVRNEQKPFFIEMQTYRYRGHSMSDPGTYRTRNEIESIKSEHDPLRQTRKRLLSLGIKESVLDAIEDEAKQTAKDAAAFALKSPEPDLDQLRTNVLVEN